MVHVIRYLCWVDATSITDLCVVSRLQVLSPCGVKVVVGTMTPTSISSDYDFLLECPTVMEAVCCFYSWVKMWWAFSFPYSRRLCL